MKRLLAVLLSIALLLGSLPALADTVLMVSNPNPNDRLNLRDAPNKEATSIAKFYNGTLVTVTNDLGDWVGVEVDGTLWGYMMKAYLTDLGYAKGGPMYAVVLSPNDHDRLNLRVFPSMESQSIGKFHRGTMVRVFGISEDWAYVAVEEPNQVRYGWMLREFLSDVDQPIADVIDELVVAQNMVNLRELPSLDAKKVGTYRAATPVQILEWTSEWARVRIGSMTGWMMQQFLSRTVEAYTLEDFLLNGEQDFYALPHTSQKVYRRLPAGTRCTLMGERDDGWAHVLVNGQAGYIRSSSVSGLEGTTWADDDHAAASANDQGAGSIMFRQATPEPNAALFAQATPEPNAALFAQATAEPNMATFSPSDAAEAEQLYVREDTWQNGLPVTMPVYTDRACTQRAFSLCAGTPVKLLGETYGKGTRVEVNGIQGYTDMPQLAEQMTYSQAWSLTPHKGVVHVASGSERKGATLYERPDETSRGTAMLSEGSEFAALAIGDYWVWVRRLDADVDGWLNITECAEPQVSITATKATVFYDAPNDQAAIFKTVDAGTTFTLLLSPGYPGWTRVYDAELTMGYVKNDALDFTGKEELNIPEGAEQ